MLHGVFCCPWGNMKHTLFATPELHTSRRLQFEKKSVQFGPLRSSTPPGLGRSVNLSFLHKLITKTLSRYSTTGGPLTGSASPCQYSASAGGCRQSESRKTLHGGISWQPRGFQGRHLCTTYPRGVWTLVRERHVAPKSIYMSSFLVMTEVQVLQSVMCVSVVYWYSI